MRFSYAVDALGNVSGENYARAMARDISEHKWAGNWINGLGNWATKRMSTGKNAEENLQMWREQLDRAIEKSGVESFRAAQARSFLAQHLEEMGNYADALPLRVEQLTILREQQGLEHVETLTAESGVAIALWGVGKLIDARDLFVHIRDVFERTEGPDFKTTEYARGMISKLDARIAEQQP
jgi:hypothetical protein